MKNLDYAIEMAETVPLTNDDIENLTSGKCRVMLYENLMNFENIEDVLAPHGAVILLYQTTERLFGHFVSLFYHPKKRNTLIFYDSYGLKMDEELSFSRYNIRNMGKLVPHLSDLIHKSNLTVESNTKKMQRDYKDRNTCGRYAALRIIFRELDNKEFNHMLSSNKYFNSDYAVTVLTLFHNDLIDLLL